MNLLKHSGLRRNFLSGGAAGTRSLSYLPLAGGTMTGAIRMTSGLAINWNADAGISRLGAASLAIGNGTAGDFTGSLKLAKVTSATQLLLEQTGDTYGTTQLALRNRNGSAGAIFINGGLDLVDFGFLTSTAAQFNLRYEHRSHQVFAANSTGEMQIINAVANSGSGSYVAQMGDHTLGFVAPLLCLGGTVSGTSPMTVDTGISRLGAASLAIGNGTAGDVSGTLTLANLVLSAPQSPASNAAGTAGQLAYDANYIYVCTASGVWKRAALTGGY